MKVYVAMSYVAATAHESVLEVFVNEQDAKRFRADYEAARREVISIRPRELRTCSILNT